MLEKNTKPVMNQNIVLREEFDDWALLFDPDTSEAYGLNPVSVFIWKHLDGENTLEEIVEKLGKECEQMPDDAIVYVKKFVDELIEKGYAGCQV